MSESNLPDFIAYFLQPDHFDHPVEQVDLIQTHISYVLIAGDFVYKIKKPVDFGFLNFASLARRRHFCAQEVLLNRRLCPDIYLDSVAISRTDNGFSLHGDGEVVEYAVKMKKMPLDGMMPDVIKRGGVDRQTIDRIVDILVPFYEQAADGPEIRKFGSAEAVAVNVLENFEQTESFLDQGALSKEQFATVKAYAQTFLEQQDLFAQRARSRVKDCHGDLYSANICLAPDQVYIFDCIEFNERFRYCDVASDVAFLAMDLDYQGLGELSDYFIKRFIEKSGDDGLQTMLNFYKCYRAYVRGKIGLFTAHAPEVDDKTADAARQAAAKYFVLAEKYAGN
ncbi:MAG: hypothetical protein C0613_04945 [Desulfobulbaceae bacterium]|nr:MAG: hypothetical protein C0613_04945 [Desulfobulbaceae bacterium]